MLNLGAAAERLRAEGIPSRIPAITDDEELFVPWHHLSRLFADHGLTPVAPKRGEVVITPDIAGCSLSVLRRDDRPDPLWQAPADSHAFRRGAVTAGTGQRSAETGPDAPGTDITQGPDASRRATPCVADVIAQIAQALAQTNDLGRIDAIAGDGDGELGMAHGSAAAPGKPSPRRGRAKAATSRP